MAAVGVGAELDLVDREELDRAVERHGLDGAGEPAGTRGHDLLLARDERHLRGTLARHHAIVVLAGEEAQGEADDAGGVAEQALDGEMCLARVGRAEHGPNPGWEAQHGTQRVVFPGRFCKRFGLPRRCTSAIQ